ncbi:MAG: hypothetical protein ACO22K_13045 [Woeseiaceae bacterium]
MWRGNWNLAPGGAVLPAVSGKAASEWCGRPALADGNDVGRAAAGKTDGVVTRARRFDSHSSVAVHAGRAQLGSRDTGLAEITLGCADVVFECVHGRAELGGQEQHDE